MNNRLKKLLFSLMIVSFFLRLEAPLLAREQVPPSPSELWSPPEDAITPALPVQTIEIPKEMAADLRNLTLSQLIIIALRNNPRTRETWFRAQSAAEEIGIRRGDYFPQIDLGFDADYARGSAVGGQFTFEQKTFSPLILFQYTIFDFGRRTADVDEARQELIAANWTHNATVQEVVLNVQQAYYQYLSARALLKSADVAVEEAQTNFTATEERRKAGVATIAEVLQAKTSLSQSSLNRDVVRGQIQTVRGVLATALGIPASTDFDIAGELPETLPLEQAEKQVESLILEAHKIRPELAAARSLIGAAEANVRRTKASRLPVISTTGRAERLYFLDPSDSSNNYSVGLAIRFPLFTGFRQKHEVKQAEADLEAIRAQARSLQQQVSLEVWTSYTDLQTATQTVKSSADLVASASESYDAALGRYRAGVGSILDLITAQAALESARAQAIQAKTDWFLAVAELARNTGTLWLSGSTGNQK